METKQVEKQNRRFSSGVRDWLRIPPFPFAPLSSPVLENRVYRTMLGFFLIRNESAEDLVRCSGGGGDGYSEFPAEIGAGSLPSLLTRVSAISLVM